MRVSDVTDESRTKKGLLYEKVYLKVSFDIKMNCIQTTHLNTLSFFFGISNKLFTHIFSQI